MIEITCPADQLRNGQCGGTHDDVVTMSGVAMYG
jgi:hypothetical protein